MRGDAVTTINPTVKPGLMNARSVANKLDYVFDHIIDNNLDIVALTWLTNEEVNNRRVIMKCLTHGFTCLRGNLIIVRDFNINWLDTSDSKWRILFNIL